MKAQVWTDGSNSTKTGWCGWAYHGFLGDQVIRGCGYERGTNQRAELRAVVEALKALPPGTEVEVISDSQYALSCMTDFRAKWEHAGFMTFNGMEVKHVELIKEGHRASDLVKATFRHVRGHTGDPGNELADVMSKSARAIAEGEDPAIDVTPFLVRE